MSESSPPPVSGLIPHARPMCLLDRVIEHTPEETVCSVEPGDSEVLARADGSVPAWVAIEYMAQCVAVHGALVARSQPAPGRPGLLLGSRRLRFEARDFVPGDPLLVRARYSAGESGLIVFDCTVSRAADGIPVVEGRLNVFRPADAGEADAGAPADA